MMDDELDELLRDAAQTYNVPPEPPREAMWEAIARARSAAAVTPIASPRRVPRWIAAAAGIAAVLVVGIAIGRASRDPSKVPSSDLAITTGLSSTTPTTAESTKVGQAPAPEDVAPPTESAAAARGTEIRRAEARRFAAAAQRGARDRTSATNDLSTDGAAYRLAVVEHLTRTEVLLTSFRAQEHSGDASRIDAQFAALSRELLGTTRLLLATRRGDDPAITRLLQDLEFVLMQLSQYANDGRRVDLDAINQSLDKRNVIPKLRATIPAGLSASSGT